MTRVILYCSKDDDPNFLKTEKSVFMKTKTNSVGALHPILFFAVMYVVVLFLSIFICSSLFYSFNSNSSSTGRIAEKTVKAQKQSFPMQVSTAVVIR